MWIGLQQLEKLYRAGNSPRRNGTPGSSKGEFSPSSGLFTLTLDESERPSSFMTSHEPPSTYEKSSKPPSTYEKSSEPPSEESSEPKRRRLEFPEVVIPPLEHSYYISDTTGLIDKEKYEEFIKIFSKAIESEGINEGINIKTTFSAPSEAQRYMFDTNILIPQHPKPEIYFKFDDNDYKGTLISSEEVLEYYLNNLKDVSKSFSIKLQNLENNSKLVFFTNNLPLF